MLLESSIEPTSGCELPAGKLYRAHFGVRIACKALGLVLSGRMVPQGTISTCHVPGMQNEGVQGRVGGQGLDFRVAGTRV